jgi:hypothetical protein
MARTVELGSTVAVTSKARDDLQFLVTANVPSSLYLSALMMELKISFQNAVLTRSTRRHIQGGGILDGFAFSTKLETRKFLAGPVFHTEMSIS